MQNPDIIIVGSGRLAKTLIDGLCQNGIQPKAILTRNTEAGNKLASQYNLEQLNWNSRLATTENEIYILTVSDDALIEVAERFIHSNALIVHCSGSRSIEILNRHKRSGIFYPLFSFNSAGLSWKEIPFFIESNTSDNLSIINTLASKLSNKVTELNSRQRLTLHIAAVFSNNYITYLSSIAENLLQEESISLEHLRPILNQTAQLIANKSNYKEFQTGPAIRKDFDTIALHLDYLNNNHPELCSVYKILAEGIQKQNS